MGKGYGSFYVNPAFGTVTAHRAAYVLSTGKDPGPLDVCHNCPEGDNRRCCNSAHLFAGTRLENLRDAVDKGRTATGDRNASRKYPARVPCGVRHGRHKLTEREVGAIRELLASGTVPQHEIARMFSVSQGTVSNIAVGRNWLRAIPLVKALAQHGCGHIGVHNGRAKLDAAAVRLIRKLGPTHTCAELARMFSISWNTVHLILQGKTWGSVE